ncbi:MAG: delta-60 repeat domain-containing protein, partial [Verrucomicrobiota bacterium]|nr:delta-60 repeat domain-containing protein [Verrucomicrobiota bacterium]
MKPFKQLCAAVILFSLSHNISSALLDPTFNPGTVPHNEINKIALQPNGRVVVAGSFKNWNGSTNDYLVRLNTDGSLDTNFTAQPNGPITGLDIDSAGRILIAGNYTFINGQASPG